MSFFRASEPRYREPRKRSRLGLVLFLALILAGLKLVSGPTAHLHEQSHPNLTAPLPILTIPTIGGQWGPDFQGYHFIGMRLRGNGAYLDLGDRRTHLPGSLLSRFFPDELILPSCLTQGSPPSQGQFLATLPIREDWPGFYGAPWTARIDGNLFALLHVFAPRKGTTPIPPPVFQIYQDYDGSQTTPAFSTVAPASFTRGSKAVLYRVFLNGPVRCLDLVVQNGENNGTGHLYYQKYHHFYDLVMTFQIQP
jgi:hypothetical protein